MNAAPTIAADGSPVVARCACGVGYTRAGFDALPLVGYLDSETGERVTAFELAFRRRMGGPLRVIVMRNCGCRSTLSREL